MRKERRERQIFCGGGAHGGEHVVDRRGILTWLGLRMMVRFIRFFGAITSHAAMSLLVLGTSPFHPRGAICRRADDQALRKDSGVEAKGHNTQTCHQSPEGFEVHNGAVQCTNADTGWIVPELSTTFDDHIVRTSRIPDSNGRRLQFCSPCILRICGVKRSQ